MVHPGRATEDRGQDKSRKSCSRQFRDIAERHSYMQEAITRSGAVVSTRAVNCQEESVHPA
jgi:hypothetical protein